MKAWTKTLLCLMGIANALSAEIPKITVTWNSIQCESSCMRRLRGQLEQGNMISNMQLNSSNGVGTFAWNAEKKFDYFFIKRAFQMVGLGLRDISIEVIGTIEWPNRSQPPRLISRKDESVFILHGPLQISNTLFISSGSLASYVITPELQRKLEDALQKVEGKLPLIHIKGDIWPSMDVPPNLIISTFERFEEKKKKVNKP